MMAPIILKEMLLFAGILVTFSSAANTCLYSSVNETAVCANTNSVNIGELDSDTICNVIFKLYACTERSVLNSFPDDLLVTLSHCYPSETVLALDPVYSSLFFSKVDSDQSQALLSKLNQEFPKLSPEWRHYLLEGIWANITQNPGISSTAAQVQWIPNVLQPFLASLSANMVQCLQYKNATCQSFQQLVKGLNMEYANMSKPKRQELYTAITSFLKYQQISTGSACSLSITSKVWMEQNFGKFSQLAEYKDFATLNAKFSPLDDLSVLTRPQMASFSLESSAANNTAALSQITGTLQNASDVYSFLTYLNEAVTSKNLSSAPPLLSQSLLNKTFEVLRPNLTSFTSSNWSELFQNKLSSVLPEITADQLSLIPQNISCQSYQAVVKGLDSKFDKMTPGKQEYIYGSFIKPYITQKGNVPTCFNQTAANSTAWVVNNMGSFLTYSTKEDLGLFANESMLQVFASDPSCLQLASRLNFTKDTATYYTSLLTSGANANLSSIPNRFLCYLSPSALKNLTAEAVLSLTQKINKQCHPIPEGQAAASALTPEEIQVAVALVNKLETFTPGTITNLGPSAVGLSLPQIEGGISDKDLESSLPSLSNVSGWNGAQSRAIVSKLLRSGFQIKSLESLGSLVGGLPSKNLQALDPNSVLSAVRNPQFARQLSSAPSVLQNTVVRQIAAVDSTPGNLIKNVPSNLVSYIPKPLLIFKSDKPNVQDLNGKKWNSDQASMFFEQVVSLQSDFTNLSPSVLQGFTCGSSSSMDNNQIKQLAKAMKKQGARLEEDQLNCLTKQVTSNGIPTDLENYPKEILMFISPLNYSAVGGCANYYANIGMADISVLPKGSPLRSTLLTQSLSCMNVTGFTLTDQNVQMLGQLVCDLNASFIENSPGSVLTQLSQCKSFTAAQESAIQKVIISGSSKLGSPSKWSTSTLKSLGGLSGTLNQEILKTIPTNAAKSWLKDAIQNSDLPRNQLVSIVKSLVPLSRTRRAAGCPDGKQITATNVKDDLLPLYYTTEELDACLDNKNLVEFLPDLGIKAFTDEQLLVLKKKLDQLYPGGYPETLLPNLGAIALFCGEEDIKKWNVTSVDTLSTLLSTGPSNSTAQTLIGKYIDLGNKINAPALNVIGNKYICLLNKTQLNLIEPSAISEAKALEISSCNQTVKDLLYLKANTSFQAHVDPAPAYYKLKKPYLGGAPATDLKFLANKNVGMDIGTFENLNPASVVGLTVDDVKGLLGTNVGDLKTHETNPVVRAWIKAQKQSDLDKLNIGLQGGLSQGWPNGFNTVSPLPAASPPVAVLGRSLLLCALLAILLS